VTCEVLGFRGNGYLRCENPPEGARNLQKCSRHAETHIPQLGFTGIHRDLRFAQKVGRRGTTGLNQREERGGEGTTAHQREKGRAGTVSPEDRRRGGEIAGEGGNRLRPRGRQRTERKECLASGARGKSFFKNRIWAHRTVYSACSVHTGQRTVAVR
jgi:hypothetical protein